MFDISEYAVFAAVVALVSLYAGWREYANANRRDATLLVVFGAGLMFAASWLAHADLT